MCCGEWARLMVMVVYGALGRRVLLCGGCGGLSLRMRVKVAFMNHEGGGEDARLFCNKTVRNENRTTTWYK